MEYINNETKDITIKDTIIRVTLKSSCESTQFIPCAISSALSGISLV